MVSCREYDILVLVEIEVFHHRSTICQFGGSLRKCLQTRPAQAHRLQTISSESVKNATRYRNCFAPARSFVEMTLRHAALVVATAYRTLFGSTQALKMWWRFQICGTSSSGPLGYRQTKKEPLFEFTCGLVQQYLFKNSVASVPFVG
jgi:hypothetical protein